jgi:hypothetical protein
MLIDDLDKISLFVNEVINKKEWNILYIL